MGKISTTRSNVESSPARRLMWIRLILLAAVLLVFGRILGNDFVNWDDNPLIYSNPNIAKPTIAGILHQWHPKDPHNSEMYNPLVFTFWWGLAHIAQLESPDFLGSKLNPYIFHAASLLVHWLSACVVLEILRRLKIGDWAALAGALIFAIHPIQTEAVAWATGMKDLLSGLFAMLAIWRYIVALQSQDVRRRWNYLLATICFIAALLSKSSTVIVPVIVAVIDRIIYRRRWRDVGKWIWPWLALALACSVVAIWVIPHLGELAPMWARPLIAADALAFYLFKIVLPIRLSFDYGRNPAAVLSDPMLHHPLYWTWIFPVAVAIVLWRAKRPMLTVSGLIFLVGLLPVLGLKSFIFQYFTTVADRYVYISMLGTALAVGWLMDRGRNRAIVGGFAVIALILGSLSFVQAGRWKDTETIYDYGLHLNQTRALHYVIFGDYKDHLANAAESIQDRDAYLDQAVVLYREAIRLEPASDFRSYDWLTRDLVEMGRIPEAIDVVRQWIAIEPELAEKQRKKPGSLEATLGSLYLKNQQYPEAIASLKRSLEILPDPDTQKILDAAMQHAGASH